jgi:D-apionolactonase
MPTDAIKPATSKPSAMPPEAKSLVYFGTAEPPPASRRFSAGPLVVDLSDGAVRHLSWHGIEVVRGIACPIRDTNWATYASVLVDENIRESPDAFEISQLRSVADGALRVKLVFQGNSDGSFHATAEMSAPCDFTTNRAGFTLLHPLRGVAGTPMQVIRPDGSISSSHFPGLISPDQVASEISGLRHSVSGIDTEIMFQGEVFEMEDQRNWSDASFKTYCRPLSLPMPYQLNAGEVQRQDIHMRFRGMPAAKTVSATGSPILELKSSTEKVPHVALAIDDSAIPDHEAHKFVSLLNPKILQLRVRPETARAVCDSAKSMITVGPAEIELEIVVPSADEPAAALARVAADCKTASLTVARVLALPENYLRSYQPAGPWPAGLRPQDLLEHARQSFPGADIGGGVLTYFTELNRCRPEMCDYLAHGSTAITHAADDRSVIESLEGLSHVYGSARAIAGGRDYRLGLVAIGMRSNPYGSGVVENVQQNRIAMAGADPRQRGIFAAAWAVGAVAATTGHDVSSLALSAFAGPFGMIHRPEPWAQPLYHDNNNHMVYPIFHVVRFLSAMGGAARLSFPALENGIVGVASRGASRTRLILANLGTHTSRVRLPHGADVRFLNAGSFLSATKDPQWLDTSQPDQVSEVVLEPLNVAFLSMPS